MKYVDAGRATGYLLSITGRGPQMSGVNKAARLSENIRCQREQRRRD
jgi:hypothetical protein